MTHEQKPTEVRLRIHEDSYFGVGAMLLVFFRTEEEYEKLVKEARKGAYPSGRTLRSTEFYDKKDIPNNEVGTYLIRPRQR